MESLLILELLFIIATYDRHETYAVVVTNLHLCSIHVMVYCCIFMCYKKCFHIPENAKMHF